MFDLEWLTAAGRADRAARRWVVRLDRGPLSPSETRRLRRWLRHQRNADAFRRAGALWFALDGLAEEAVEATAEAALPVRAAPR